MKKVFALLTLLAAVAVAAVAASPANAVEFGEPDTANAHPWFGLRSPSTRTGIRSGAAPAR